MVTILHTKIFRGCNIHCNILLYGCSAIFIDNWIRTNILKLLKILLSITRIAKVFILLSTALLFKQLLIKKTCSRSVFLTIFCFKSSLIKEATKSPIQ